LHSGVNAKKLQLQRLRFVSRAIFIFTKNSENEKDHKTG